MKNINYISTTAVVVSMICLVIVANLYFQNHRKVQVIIKATEDEATMNAVEKLGTRTACIVDCYKDNKLTQKDCVDSCVTQQNFEEKYEKMMDDMDKNENEARRKGITKDSLCECACKRDEGCLITCNSTDNIWLEEPEKILTNCK